LLISWPTRSITPVNLAMMPLPRRFFAEMFPAVTQKERMPTAELPGDEPNFPHDLEPVIRPYPPHEASSQGAVDCSRIPKHAAPGAR